MRLYLILLFAAVLIFVPSLKYGFSQDDFIHLYHSRASSLQDVINFFNPSNSYTDIFFYRPLTTQFYFFINQLLFGINALPFRIEALVGHLVNGFLFYLIVRKLWQDELVAKLSAFLYTISAAHFLSIYYISAFQQIGKTFFIFISIWLFFKSSKKYYFLSILSFILALLSKESALILPAVIILTELFMGEKDFFRNFKKNLLLISPFLFILGLYLVIRLVGINQAFGQGEYRATFNLFEILQNLKWYLLWSFGLPEIFSSFPSLSPVGIIQIIKDLPVSFWIFCLFFATVFLLLKFMLQTTLNWKKITLSLLIFIAPLLPVLFLFQHRYPQYLDMSFLGLLPLITYLVIFNRGRKLFKFSFIFCFISLQLLSLHLSEQTHWTTHRSKVATYYFDLFRTNHPIIEEGTTVFFIGAKEPARELSIALAKHYSLAVWYPKKIKSVEYILEDIQIDKKIIVPITQF